ncbi:MAG: hypothetical protein HQL14_04035 [Candidatus Omnitrophica bacterium]|nr:hypothetical protein [Candidatus Omnitrophota bacterium]
MEKILSYISNFEIQDIKRFLSKAARFFPILIGIVCLNILVDPGDMFLEKDHARKTATQLACGKNIGNYRPVDDVLTRKYTIEIMPVSDIVVLGSSRSAEIGENIFPNKKIMNLWISGGSLLDDLALLSVMDEQKKMPRTLIIGIDPWMFSSEPRRSETSDDIQKFLKKLGSNYHTKPSFDQSFWIILSLSYFQQAANILFTHDHLFVRRNFPTDENCQKLEYTLLKDGTLSWAETYRARTKEEVRQLTIPTVHIGGKMFTFKPDQALEKVMEQMILYLQSRGVEVIFYFPPYHEYAYQWMSLKEKTFKVLEMDRYFQDLARKLKVRIIGSFDPRQFDQTGDGFYDSYHARPDLVKKIFNSYESSPKF